jgi:AraC family transcriptional regulator
MKDYNLTLHNDNKISHFTTGRMDQAKLSSDFTLRFVLSGSEICQINKRSIGVNPNCFLLIQQGTHYVTSGEIEEPSEVLSLSYSNSFLKDFLNSVRFTNRQLLNGRTCPCSFAEEGNETIYPFTGNIKYNIYHLRAVVRERSTDELLLNEYLYHCLINYYNILREETCLKTESIKLKHKSTRTEVFRRLKLAREYMYTNQSHNITLEELSAYSCLSVNHLLRTFKQAFNQSPHQFLTSIRLQKALFLLKNSRYSVNEIASMVGFDSPSSFIRLFRVKMKVTPNVYKQQVLS